MMSDIEKVLEENGLPPVGGLTRSEEFHVACDHLTEALIGTIEEMMDGEVNPKHRFILHCMIERIANMTGPQLTVTEE